MPELFVYGSLRRGERYHHWLQSALFVGLASTLPAMTMLDLGRYPAVIEGGTTSIIGEIYDVDEGLLQQLDRFEGHPDEYRRTSVALADGRQAFLYLWQREQGEFPVVDGGDWSTFLRLRGD